MRRTAILPVAGLMLCGLTGLVVAGDQPSAYPATNEVVPQGPPPSPYNVVPEYGVIVPAPPPASRPLPPSPADHLRTHCFDEHGASYFLHHDVNHGAVGSHHGRVWKYVDGEHHGFPYGCSHYLPRAAGASYTFGRWVPRRSFYYAYQPGGPQMPYGYSPEPYYYPQP